MKSKKGVHSIPRYIIFGLSVLLFFLIGWILIVVLKTPKYQVPDIKEWKTGDIFFSVGDSWKSIVVRGLTGVRDLEMPDSTPSHCGIVLRDKENVWLVHESTDKKKLVKEKALEYQKINGSYCIFVRSVPSNIDTARLKRNIDHWLRMEKPFDFDFNHRDSTALYCTEFVVELMEKNGCNIFSALRENQYIYPKELKNICEQKGRLLKLNSK